MQRNWGLKRQQSFPLTVRLNPIPIPPISMEPLDTTSDILTQTTPINDLDALALHVAQLTMAVADIKRRLDNDDGSHN